MGQEITYSAVVEEVHSGDDLLLMVNLGVDGLYKKVRARLRGVDTPSAFKASSSTQAGAVRDYVKKAVEGRQCKIVVHSTGRGGWLVTLLVKANACDGAESSPQVNLNELLIAQGYTFKQGLADNE